MYSAQTRVGSLPEDVLAAMRTEEADALLAQRTASGTRRAVRPVTPEPFSTVRPRSESPVAIAPEIPTLSYELVFEDAPPRASLARSIVIVLLFALLGGLVACAILLDVG
jgi:hypothetical protein